MDIMIIKNDSMILSRFLSIIVHYWSINLWIFTVD